MRSAKATIALIILVGCALGGCSLDRWVEVEAGEYTPVSNAGMAGQAAGGTVRAAKIDRDRQTVTFTLADGSEMAAAFVARDRASWPSGCPTNINSTRMEVLDLEEDRLTVGSTTFNHPVLVRDCPPEPVRIVLREDGAIGGGGGACIHLEQCITFERRETAVLTPVGYASLPPSTPTPSRAAGTPASTSPAAASTSAPAPTADLPQPAPTQTGPAVDTAPPTPTADMTQPAPTPVPMKTGPVVDIPGSDYGLVELSQLDPPACCLALAPDGERLAYATCRTTPQEVIVQNVDGSGLKEVNSLWPSHGDGPCPDPAWSPDGQQLAFVDHNNGLYVVNADGTNLTRLEPEGLAPTWSPDGQHIAFTAYLSSQRGYAIAVMNRDGRDVRPLTNTETGDQDQRAAWSPDGQHIAFVSNRDGNREIYVMNRDGGDQKRLTYHDAQDWGPVWSPDGRHIVFSSERDGRRAIYVMKSDGADPRWLMDTDAPHWWPSDTTRVRFIEDAE